MKLRANQVPKAGVTSQGNSVYKIQHFGCKLPLTFWIDRSGFTHFDKPYNSDIDLIITDAGGTPYYLNVKSSANALNGGTSSFSTSEAERKMRNWLGSLEKRDVVNFKTSVRIVVPSGVVASPGIKTVINGLELDSTKVFSPEGPTP